MSGGCAEVERLRRLISRAAADLAHWQDEYHDCDCPAGQSCGCKEFRDICTGLECALIEANDAGTSGRVAIAHDGFAGDIIGHYVTREGKRGVVVQQDGTRVVHVYGEKWLAASPPAEAAP